MHLGRPREALDAVLAVDAAEARLERRRARRPHEPVALVERAAGCGRGRAPSGRRRRAGTRSSRRRRRRRRAARGRGSNASQTCSGRMHSCTSQPSVASASPSVRAIAVLPISGGPVTTAKRWRSSVSSVRAVGARRHEDPGELARGGLVPRRARPDGVVEQRVEVAHAEHASARGGALPVPRREARRAARGRSSTSGRQCGRRGRSAVAEHALRRDRCVREHEERREAAGRAELLRVDERWPRPDRARARPAPRPRRRDHGRPRDRPTGQRVRHAADDGPADVVGSSVPGEPVQPVRGEELVAELLELEPAELVEAVGRLRDRPSLAGARPTGRASRPCRRRPASGWPRRRGRRGRCGSSRRAPRACSAPPLAMMPSICFAAGPSTKKPITKVAMKPRMPKVTQKLPQLPGSLPVSFSIIAMPMTRTISDAGVNTRMLTSPPAWRGSCGPRRRSRARR